MNTHKMMQSTSIAKQGGFTIALSLFVLVAMSAMGIAIWKSFVYSQEEMALDAMQNQAYQAAKAGAEIGVYRSLRGDGACPATKSLSFVLTQGSLPALPAWRIEAYCHRETSNENGQPILSDTWTSVSCNASSCSPSSASGSYVSRTVTVQVAH